MTTTIVAPEISEHRFPPKFGTNALLHTGPTEKAVKCAENYRKPPEKNTVTPDSLLLLGMQDGMTPNGFSKKHKPPLSIIAGNPKNKADPSNKHKAHLEIVRRLRKPITFEDTSSSRMSLAAKTTTSYLTSRNQKPVDQTIAPYEHSCLELMASRQKFQPFTFG